MAKNLVTLYTVYPSKESHNLATKLNPQYWNSRLGGGGGEGLQQNKFLANFLSGTVLANTYQEAGVMMEPFES